MEIPTAPAQRFTASFTPCHPLSVFHDLRCGHRIEVAYDSESCGSNCVRRNRAAPFICPHCLVADVRVEMLFEGLDLDTTVDTTDGMDLDEAVEAILDEMDIDSDGPSDSIAGSSNSTAQEIADRELDKLLKQGKRMCKIAPRFKDPALQFWHQYLVQEGLEGLESEVDIVLGPSRTYKRPLVRQTQQSASASETNFKRPQARQRQQLDGLTSVSQDMWKPRGQPTQRDEDEVPEETSRMTGIVEDGDGAQEAQVAAGADGDDGMGDLVFQLGEVRVGLELEDEATKAVREAFDLCELTGGWL